MALSAFVFMERLFPKGHGKGRKKTTGKDTERRKRFCERQCQALTEEIFGMTDRQRRDFLGKGQMVAQREEIFECEGQMVVHSCPANELYLSVNATMLNSTGACPSLA